MIKVMLLWKADNLEEINTPVLCRNEKAKKNWGEIPCREILKNYGIFCFTVINNMFMTKC